VQWRRWTPLPVLTTALSEGVIPDGQNLTEEEVTATVYQYGGYTTKSDLYDLTHMDANLKNEIKMLASQGARSIDAKVRDVMATTSTTQYANSRTSMYTIRTSDKLTVDEIRKMVRTLKKNNTPTFKRGGKAFYMAIIGPDTEYDIMDDAKWINVATYQDKEKIYNGEIGTLYRVRFLETTECKKYEPFEIIADSVSVTIASISGATLTIDEAMTAAEAAAITGKYVNIFDISDTSLATAERQQIVAAASGASGAAKITLDAAPSSFTAADGDLVYANDYGWNGNPVYSTFVFGDEAYAMADIKGSGKIRTIVKSAKEIGGPLEQYGTVGWKVDGMAVEILQDLFIGQIFHGASE
jgi:hypothetical protein